MQQRLFKRRTIGKVLILLKDCKFGYMVETEIKKNNNNNN